MIKVIVKNAKLRLFTPANSQGAGRASSTRSMRPGRTTALGLALGLALVAAQRGQPHRCRNRDPMCETWGKQGECSKNHDFMAESCPVACSLCENGGLEPTPAVFELDFVCSGQLSIAPKDLKGLPSDSLPDGCSFRCRDNAETCFADAQKGACTKHAKHMRFQCAETCGVCKALGVTAGEEYPKKLCTKEDASEQCPGWARNGACADNFGFMGESCGAACGVCKSEADGGVAPKSVAEIAAAAEAKPKKASKKGGKKGKKAAGKKAGGAAAAAAAEPAAKEPAATPAPKESKPAEPKGKGKAGEAKAASKGWLGGMKDKVFGKKKAKDEV